MAYDRYDTRDSQRDERSRWRDDNRSEQRGWGRDDRSERGGRDERGFFERAGDEIASWFGDEEAERRRHQDQMRDDPNRGRSSREHGSSWGQRDERDRTGGSWSQGRERQGGGSGWSQGRGEDRGWSGRDRDDHRSWNRDRDDRQDSWFETRGSSGRGGFSERDYNPSWQRELSRGRDQDRSYGNDRGGYRPMTGDYGRSEQPGGWDRAERSFGGGYDRDHRSDSEWDRDPYRSSSRAGTSDRSDRSRHEDPNYHSWRSRHMSELDRDYDDFRREHQSRFEDDFASWRDKRQQKRGLLGQIREHMEVVGSDDQHVGTVDKVAGDRVILTKSDPESGGSHHSLSCSDIDRVDGNRVILDCKADDARKRWRDESRSRALFERDDQGEMGPGMLDRSFSGTYR